MTEQEVCRVKQSFAEVSADVLTLWLQTLTCTNESEVKC